MNSLKEQEDFQKLMREAALAENGREELLILERARLNLRRRIVFRMMDAFSDSLFFLLFVVGGLVMKDSSYHPSIAAAFIAIGAVMGALNGFCAVFNLWMLVKVHYLRR